MKNNVIKVCDLLKILPKSDFKLTFDLYCYDKNKKLIDIENIHYDKISYDFVGDIIYDNFLERIKDLNIDFINIIDNQLFINICLY